MTVALTIGARAARARAPRAGSRSCASRCRRTARTATAPASRRAARSRRSARGACARAAAGARGSRGSARAAVRTRSATGGVESAERHERRERRGRGHRRRRSPFLRRGHQRRASSTRSTSSRAGLRGAPGVPGARAEPRRRQEVLRDVAAGVPGHPREIESARGAGRPRWPSTARGRARTRASSSASREPGKQFSVPNADFIRFRDGHVRRALGRLRLRGDDAAARHRPLDVGGRRLGSSSGSWASGRPDRGRQLLPRLLRRRDALDAPGEPGLLEREDGEAARVELPGGGVRETPMSGRRGGCCARTRRTRSRRATTRCATRRSIRSGGGQGNGRSS